MARRLRIPKAFGLFAHRVVVERRKHVRADDGDPAHGLWVPEQYKVLLETMRRGQRSNIEQSFCHEVVHSWLSSLGYNELSENETFVDQLGQAFHQYLTTVEY
jgi:hypothetical protein